MRKIEAIFFDLDGTLIDSRRDIAESLNFTRLKLGLAGNIYPEEINSFIGGGFEETVRKSLGTENGQLTEKALSIFKKYYQEHPLVYTTLYPGAVSTLKYFKRKKLAIITNKSTETAEKILKGLNIRKYFANLAGGDNEKDRKPSPEIIKMFLKSFNIEKEKAVIIGDMEIDILTGKNAGIITCFAAYGIGGKNNLMSVKPDFEIDNLTRLKELFC